MKHIKDVYFHIKGTPKQNEVFKTVTDNYVSASLIYVKGKGYYWLIYRCGRYTLHNDCTGEDVKMDNYTIGGSSQSMCECLLPCNRAGKTREREAIKIFDSNVFTTIRERLGYDTESWEVRTS